MIRSVSNANWNDGGCNELSRGADALIVDVTNVRESECRQNAQSRPLSTGTSPNRSVHAVAPPRTPENPFTGERAKNEQVSSFSDLSPQRLSESGAVREPSLARLMPTRLIEVSTVKHVILAASLASALLLPTADPAWAHGFGGAPMGHAVPRGGAIVGHPHLPGRAVVPYDPLVRPAFTWGLAFDPYWYGAVGPYEYSYVAPAGTVTGGLRLEITPKTAQVYADGAYAGVVDDFNGHFQHLDLTPGGHHIDVIAPGFQPLAFDTYIQPDHTTDYKAGLAPLTGSSE